MISFPYSSADEGSVECISCQAESISFCFTVALPYFLLQVNSVVSFVLSFFLVHLLFVFSSVVVSISLLFVYEG